MIRQTFSVVTTLAIFFILLFVYTKAAGPIPFTVNSITTQKSTTFDVIGEGKAEVKADSGTVSAGVSAQGATTQEVQSKINSISSSISTAIKELGVDPKDIQTSNYNINPNYDYSSGGQKQTGFSGSTTLTIKVKDVSKVGTVIDAATKAGATNVSQLGLTSEDKTKAEEEARKLAVQQAKSKAQTIAQTAGFRLGNIINYSENSGGSQPVPMLRATGSPQEKDNTTIEPGTNEVRITVILSYEIR